MSNYNFKFYVLIYFEIKINNYKMLKNCPEFLFLRIPPDASPRN